MTFTFPIPLMQETAIAFQDSFDSKNPVKDARAWIYQLLTKIGVTWSSTQGNGGFGVKFLDDNGKLELKDISLKEIKIEDYLPLSDPNWIPKLWDKNDVQAFEIKIGQTLIEKLRNVFAITRYGTIKLNDSVVAWEKKRDVKPEEKEAHEKTLEKDIENSKEFQEYPLEKFLHGILLKPILDKVGEHEKKILDKEFEKLYEEENKEKPPLPGERPDPKEKKTSPSPTPPTPPDPEVITPA